MSAVRELQSPTPAPSPQPAAVRRPEAAWNAASRRQAAGRGKDGGRQIGGRTKGRVRRETEIRRRAGSGVTVTEGKPGERPSERNPHALKSFDGLKPGDALVHRRVRRGRVHVGEPRFRRDPFRHRHTQAVGGGLHRSGLADAPRSLSSFLAMSRISLEGECGQRHGRGRSHAQMGQTGLAKQRRTAPFRRQDRQEAEPETS